MDGTLGGTLDGALNEALNEALNGRLTVWGNNTEFHSISTCISINLDTLIEVNYKDSIT